MSNENKPGLVQSMAAVLVGWCFVIIEQNQIVARGVVLASDGPYHLVQFQGSVPYSRLLNAERMQALTLFESEEEANAFIEQWTQLYPQNLAPANEEDTASLADIDTAADGPYPDADDDGTNEEGPPAVA